MTIEVLFISEKILPLNSFVCAAHLCVSSSSVSAVGLSWSSCIPYGKSITV